MELPIKAEYSGEPFKGIFYKINESMNVTNAHDSKIVEIIPSDKICKNFSKIIEKDFKSHWFSYMPNPWLAINFLNRKVIVEGYSIRSYSGQKGYAHLKSWDVEVSNNQEEWKVIDSVRDCEEMNNEKAEVYFPVKEKVSEAYQYVRFRMVGQSWSGADFMVLRGIELFGIVE
jgi:hypothetical protein